MAKSRHMRTGASALLLAALVSLAAPSGAFAEQKLGGAQIRKTLAGKTASWVANNGQYVGKTSWKGDGTLSGTVLLNGNVQPFAGSWHIRGNQFCQTIAMDPKGTRCQSMAVAGRGKYHLYGEDGTLTSVMTFN